MKKFSLHKKPNPHFRRQTDQPTPNAFVEALTGCASLMLAVFLMFIFFHAIAAVDPLYANNNVEVSHNEQATI